MSTNRWVLKGLMLFTLFFFLCFLIPDEVFARAGGGRSSSGSRGSRTSSAPASPTSPSPTSPSRSVTSPTPATPAAQPMQQPSMWRSIAGGVMGGMIGGMLFRSLGFGAPGEGGMGGGIGLFEIVLIGAILYFLYRFIKRRREEATAGAYYQGGQSMGTATPSSQPAYVPSAGNASADDVQQGISHVRQMDAGFDEKIFTDACMDVFFQIQGAWANRDMSTAKNALTDEMYGILSGDAQKLKAEKKINRLDNIAVRSVDITEVWQEAGQDYITVRFLASLLDYTIDESTKQVLSGSRTEPVKFEEYWTFTRPVGRNTWKLSAIQQAQ
jgi:predicted lipid-binding transport protein (Tim44 family)